MAVPLAVRLAVMLSEPGVDWVTFSETEIDPLAKADPLEEGSDSRTWTDPL